MNKEKQTYQIALNDCVFKNELRNILVKVDGTYAELDLIPSVILNQPTERVDPDLSPELSDIIKNSRPIVEHTEYLRVSFEYLYAISIQEEFVDIIDILDDSFAELPSLKNSKMPYPFLEVVNSKWKNQLPEYRGKEEKDLKHYKIFSMETHIDILACIDKYEWLESK